MKPKVIQDPAKPIEREVLAAYIIEMSRAVQRLAASGLNHEAICILTQHKSGVGMGNVRAVLDALAELESAYPRKASS